MMARQQQMMQQQMMMQQQQMQAPRPQPSFVQAFPSQQAASAYAQPQPQPQPVRPQAPQGFAPPWAQPTPAPQQRQAEYQPQLQPVAATPNPEPQQADPLAGLGEQAVFAEHAAAAEPAPQIDLNPEHVGEFLQELEKAIRTGLIPPGLFAAGLIDKIGADTARVLLSTITPEQITEMVQAQENGGSTAIATRDGQRYLRELWSAAQSQLGG